MASQRERCDLSGLDSCNWLIRLVVRPTWVGFCEGVGGFHLKRPETDKPRGWHAIWFALSSEALLGRSPFLVGLW